jgi:hypothetical protein
MASASQRIKAIKKSKTTSIKSRSLKGLSSKKLKKIRKELTGNIAKAEKHVDKLKKDKAKKNKIKSLMNLLAELLKSEKKVRRELKKVKAGKSDGDGDGKKSPLPQEEKKDTNANKQTARKTNEQVTSNGTISVSTNGIGNLNPEPAHQQKSIDLHANEAITKIRSMVSAAEIDRFILQDHRKTVINAANSRIKALQK